MAIRKILCLLRGDATGESLLDHALDFASRNNAFLCCLHVEPDSGRVMMPAFFEGVTSSLAEETFAHLREEFEAQSKRSEEQFRDRCGKAGVTVVDDEKDSVPGQFAACFVHRLGEESEQLVTEGRLSDVIVMAKPSESGDAAIVGFEAALFETGRPVLMVPKEAPEGFGTKVAIAWIETQEASAAVAAAMPLLTAAEKVAILSGHKVGETASPSRLASYLAHHGIDAKTWSFALDSSPDGEQIMVQAEQAEANLIVMGAYGHSRLRETILGGATRSILEKAQIPILFAR